MCASAHLEEMAKPGAKVGGGSQCSALAPLLRAPSLKPSCSKASNAGSWSLRAPCVIYIRLTGASGTATWACVAPQTLFETASLPLLPAMALGFMVLLLVGTVGTGKGGGLSWLLSGGSTGGAAGRTGLCKGDDGVSREFCSRAVRCDEQDGGWVMGLPQESRGTFWG